MRQFDIIVGVGEHPLHQELRADLENRGHEVFFTETLREPKTRHALAQSVVHNTNKAARNTIYWLGMGFRRSIADGQCIGVCNRNVVGTAAVLCFARSHGFKRVVIKSSFEVVQYPQMTADGTVAGAVVRAAEEIALAYSGPRLSVSVLRLGLLYGPGMEQAHFEESETISLMYKPNIPAPLLEDVYYPMIKLQDAAKELVEATPGISHKATEFPSVVGLFTALRCGEVVWRKALSGDYAGISDLSEFQNKQATTPCHIADEILIDKYSNSNGY